MFSKTCNRFYPSRDLILLVIYLFISLRYVTVFVFSHFFKKKNLSPLALPDLNDVKYFHQLTLLPRVKQ